VEPGGAPRMAVEGGRHVYTDGTRRWPSASSLVARMNPYDGPKWEGPEADSPAAVGTRAHAAMEAMARGRPSPVMPDDTAVRDHVRHLSTYLARIGDVHAVEQPVLSRMLNVAGTVDMVAEYDGELSVIDWKTKRRPPGEAAL